MAGKGVFVFCVCACMMSTSNLLLMMIPPIIMPLMPLICHTRQCSMKDTQQDYNASFAMGHCILHAGCIAECPHFHHTQTPPHRSAMCCLDHNGCAQDGHWNWMRHCRGLGCSQHVHSGMPDWIYPKWRPSVHCNKHMDCCNLYRYLLSWASTLPRKVAFLHIPSMGPVWNNRMEEWGNGI